MNIFQNLYIRASRKKFCKSIKSMGLQKKNVFLVSPPPAIKDFLKILNFLGGLEKLGRIILLASKGFLPYIKLLRRNFLQPLYWTRMPEIMTKEFDALKILLKQWEINYLIELNNDANLSLPYLLEVDKRIAFYDKKNYPYYNILIKGGIDSLKNFFQISPVEPAGLFIFNKQELKGIAKTMPTNRPLLFFNATDKCSRIEDGRWLGGVVVHDKTEQDIEIALKKIYICDAYAGPDDEFCEFARIFRKEIIDCIGI